MQRAITHFQKELAGVRTGRANPGLIDSIMVNAHGDHAPLKACGAVTVRAAYRAAGCSWCCSEAVLLHM